MGDGPSVRYGVVPTCVRGGWATLAGKYNPGLSFGRCTEITGGAPLLALFEKWPAEPPTPSDSATSSLRFPGAGPPFAEAAPPLRLQGWELNTYDAAGNQTSKTNYLIGVTSIYGCSNSRVIFPPQYR
jgi:hypothetical protein